MKSKRVASLLRRLADRFDSPRCASESGYGTVEISMKSPSLDWITSRHETPHPGDYAPTNPDDASWEHAPRWTSGCGGVYL